MCHGGFETQAQTLRRVVKYRGQNSTFLRHVLEYRGQNSTFETIIGLKLCSQTYNKSPNSIFILKTTKKIPVLHL